MKFLFKLICALIIAAAVSAATYSFYERRRDAEFLSRLTGDIVFNRRDGDQVNVYRISAGGANEKLVFAGDDAVNRNALAPVWTEDKTAIRFRAMQGGEWKTFVTNRDGGDARIVDEPERKDEPEKTADGIRLDRGDVYARDEDGTERVVYRFGNPLGYDAVLSPGARHASWSPDRQFVVFDSCGYMFCRVMIADRRGARVVALADGMNPDWK